MVIQIWRQTHWPADDTWYSHDPRTRTLVAIADSLETAQIYVDQFDEKDAHYELVESAVLTLATLGD